VLTEIAEERTQIIYTVAAHVQGNQHVRDLSKLNRDLSRTLFIVGESNAHTVLQQENVLVIPDWKDMDSSDRTLLDILPLLEILSKQDVLDVRVVCQSYKGTDVVQEFRRRMEAAANQPPKPVQPVRSRFGF
jgi:mitochondrial import inner membrane translocase subunit TIM50